MDKEDAGPRLPEEVFGANPFLSQISLKPAAFYFRERHGKLDWRKIARIDVDQVIREVDLIVLQELLDEVAFSDITVEDLSTTRVSDISVKLIRLSQLTIEYLLYVQERQDSCIRGLGRRLEAAIKRSRHLEYGVNPAGLKAAAVANDAPPPSKRNRLDRKMEQQQQQQQQQQHKERRDSSPVVEVRVCNTCGKAFSSEGFLKKHITRRHPDLLEESTAAEIPGSCCHVRDNGGEGTGGNGDSRHLSPGTEWRHNNDDGEQQKVVDSLAAGNDGEEVDKEGKGDICPRPPRTNGRRGDEEGVEEDVEEGARRLGELVREREAARFRSEMEALRKEIQDLKAEKNDLAEEAPPAPLSFEQQQAPSPSPPPPPPPPISRKEENGERRRRWIRGVIAIRRIVRRFQSKQKAAALADWRRFSAHRPLISQPVDGVKHRAQTTDNVDDPSITARQVEELLAAAHRRADAAAQKAEELREASIEAGKKGQDPRTPIERMLPVCQGSGMNARDSPQQAKAVRERAARELRERANRLFGVDDVHHTGLCEEEHVLKMEELLSSRRLAMAMQPELRGAYAAVAVQLQHATASAESASTPCIPSSTRPSTIMETPVGCDVARVSCPYPYNFSYPSRSSPRGVSRQNGGRSGEQSTGMGSFSGGRRMFEGGTGETGGGESIGMDSKELLAIAKRNAAMNLEAFRQRRSMTVSKQAAKTTAANIHDGGGGSGNRPGPDGFLDTRQGLSVKMSSHQKDPRVAMTSSHQSDPRVAMTSSHQSDPRVAMTSSHQPDPRVAMTSSHQPDPRVAMTSSHQPDPRVAMTSSHQPDPRVAMTSSHQPDPRVAMTSSHQPDPRVAMTSSHQPDPKVTMTSSHQPDPRVTMTSSRLSGPNTTAANASSYEASNSHASFNPNEDNLWDNRKPLSTSTLPLPGQGGEEDGDDIDDKVGCFVGVANRNRSRDPESRRSHPTFTSHSGKPSSLTSSIIYQRIHSGVACYRHGGDGSSSSSSPSAFEAETKFITETVHKKQQREGTSGGHWVANASDAASTVSEIEYKNEAPGVTKTGQNPVTRYHAYQQQHAPWAAMRDGVIFSDRRRRATPGDITGTATGNDDDEIRRGFRKEAVNKNGGYGGGAGSTRRASEGTSLLGRGYDRNKAFMSSFDRDHGEVALSPMSDMMQSLQQNQRGNLSHIGFEGKEEQRLDDLEESVMGGANSSSSIESLSLPVEEKVGGRGRGRGRGRESAAAVATAAATATAAHSRRDVTFVENGDISNISKNSGDSWDSFRVKFHPEEDDKKEENGVVDSVDSVKISVQAESTKKSVADRRRGLFTNPGTAADLRVASFSSFSDDDIIDKGETVAATVTATAKGVSTKEEKGKQQQGGGEEHEKNELLNVVVVSAAAPSVAAKEAAGVNIPDCHQQQQQQQQQQKTRWAGEGAVGSRNSDERKGFPRWDSGRGGYKDEGEGGGEEEKGRGSDHGVLGGKIEEQSSLAFVQSLDDWDDEVEGLGGISTIPPPREHQSSGSGIGSSFCAPEGRSGMIPSTVGKPRQLHDGSCTADDTGLLLADGKMVKTMNVEEILEEADADADAEAKGGYDDSESREFEGVPAGGVKWPMYGSLTLGTGLSWFPKR